MTILKLDSRPRRFAVVGAGGASGLAVLKVASQELRDHIIAGDCELVGFEQRQDLGGVWLPDPHPSPSPNQKWPETPIYESLTTNMPHPTMFYPSHLAAPSTPLYTVPGVVQSYMESYARRFSLHQYISFRSQVTAATWDQSIDQWRVVYHKRQGSSDTTEVAYFDHLLLANGHHRHPFVPEIAGLDTWAASESRSYAHSIWYRVPEPYRDRQVLVVGGGRSSIDISNDISTIAKKIVHSIRSRGDEEFEHIIQRGAISHFTSDGFVHFVNGKKEYVDRVILATGYQYDYSFLTQLPTHDPCLESDHLYSSGFHLYPLALHMFPLQAAFPPSSLAFIDIPYDVPAFTLSEAQGTLAIRQMTGIVSLDFKNELREAIKRNEQLRKIHGDSALEVARAWHRFGKAHAGLPPLDMVDLIWEKAGDSKRVPMWKHRFAPLLLVIRAEWQELERLGLAKSWADGVGKGGIQEWIDLMQRVVARAKERQYRAIGHLD